MELNPNKMMIDFTEAKKGFSFGENAGFIKAIRRTTVLNQDVASINNAAVGGLDITVPGIAIGDVVLAIAPNVDPGDDYTCQGTVTAANTVRLTCRNNSGGAVDLAGTVDWEIIWADLT